MKSIFNAINYAIDKILAGTGLVSVALILLLAFFIATQVFSRYILSAHIPGLFDLSIYSLIIFTFLSAAYTLWEGQHISVDLISLKLPEGTRLGFEIGVYVVALFFAFILGWIGWQWAYLSFSTGVETISETPIPKGILILAIVLGAFLLILQIIRIISSSVMKAFCARSLQNASNILWNNPLISIVIFVTGLIAGLMLCVYFNKIVGICFLVFFILLCGMPVFLALGFVGCVGLYILIGESALRQIPFLAYRAVESFPLTCLPLFIIAGIILEKGKIVDEVFLLFRYFMGNFVSAPLVTTILVGGFFCAISGSSVATTSLIAAVSLPILTNQGYRKSLSSGAVAGSTIGTVIPPSIGYILYGVITGESIGQLFIAGIIPAIIIFSFYCLYIISRSVISKQSLFEVGESMARQSRQDASWKDKIRTLQNASWGLFAPIFVLGGIYMGIFTPSEAAAVMVMYAIVITVLIMKTLTLEQLLAAVLVGAKISSMILLIIVGARIFGAVTSQLGIAADLVAFTERAGIPPIGSLALVSLMLIVLGMFLDAGSIMVITLPVFYPLIMKVGFNSVWFGVFYIIILEIGLLTPPVGLNLFVIKGLSDFPMGTIIRGVLPFIFILFLSLLILTLFPQLVIWLPAVMIK